MIPVNITLWEEGEDIIPSQLYNKVRFKELLFQYINQLQISNDQIFDILDNLNVDDATGYLLDCVGSYVAVTRNGETDEPFRDRIKNKVLVASSEGTPNELLELLSTITKGDTRIWEHFPVSCTFYTDGQVVPTNLVQNMQSASPASSGDVVVYLDPDKNSFVPAEIGFSVLKLANQDLNPFVTGDPIEPGLTPTTLLTPTTNMSQYNNIVTPQAFITVNNLAYGGDGQEDLAILSEFTYGQGEGVEVNTPDGYGVLCEIAYNDGGVQTFNYEDISFANTVLSLYWQMNFTTPALFE